MTQLTNLKNPDLETQIEFVFIDTINLWRNKLGDLAKVYEVSRLERRILVFLGRFPSIRQSDLANYMDVEPQSLTRALEAMEQKKWLIKTDDVKDKRAKCLVLTVDGQSKLESSLNISEEIRGKILNNISLEEKTNLIKTLNSIQANLKNI